MPQVVSGSSFRVGDTRRLGQRAGGWECQEVQRPATVTFTPLPEALDHAPIVAAEEMKVSPSLLRLGGCLGSASVLPPSVASQDILIRASEDRCASHCLNITPAPVSSTQGR